MNIIYVTSNYETVQKQILSHMRSAKHDCKLFYFHERYRKDNPVLPENVLYYNLRSHMRGPLFLLTRLRRVAKELESVIKEEKIDVLHGNMCFSDGYICRYIKRKRNIQYVVSVRDTDVNMSFLWKLPWLKRQLVNNLVDADKIVFLSSSYREKLLSKLPERYRNVLEIKSVIIPNGIDDFYLQNKCFRNRTESDINIIFVGKLQTRKNLELTVDAAKKLIKKGYNVTVTAVGALEEEKYKTLINENDFIRYIEKSPKEMILLYYRDANVFVMPSHTETFGLTYAEAMSQGLPVLYTKKQGFDGQFPDGEVGYAVDDYDSDDLADKIIRIFNDYLRISNNCSKLCDKFSWDKIISQLIELYLK